MPRTVDYEDPLRMELIQELKASAKKEDAGIWKDLAAELSKPRKNRREVNMWKLSKYTAAGETVVVPGKVLGDGVLEHKINIAAYKFSDAARRKIEQSGGKMMSIADLVKKNPKGSNIKLIA